MTLQEEPFGAGIPEDPSWLPGPLEDAPAVERLARWDELPPDALEELAAHPRHGRALAALQALEEELEATASPETPCPDAEELYSFGEGPGAEAMTPFRRGQVRAHLDACGACRDLVSTLRATPPPPLFMDGLEAQPVRPEQGQLLRWAPAAAAAAVLVAFGAHWSGAAVDAAWPEQPVVRGSADEALLFPRGRVLSGALGSWAARPLYEVEPGQTFTRAWIRVRRTDGSAFDAGVLVEEWTAAAGEPLVGQALPPGHYTWELEVEQDGLRRRIGSRSFEVRTDPAIRRALGELQGVKAIALLHGAGYWTDARAAARLEPPSPERDAYLATPPPR